MTLRALARIAGSVVLLSAVAALLVAVSVSPGTMSWLREDYASIGEPMNWLESLTPGFDLVHVLLFIGIAVPLALLWRGARWWTLALVLLALAVCTELLQFAIPGRSPLVLDVRDDLLGAALGLAIGLALRWPWRADAQGTGMDRADDPCGTSADESKQHPH